MTATDMNGTWIDVGEELQLKLPSGDVRMVPAMDVYRAVFQNASTVQGVSVRSPAVDLPHLNFSRFPAEPAVRTTTGDGCIRIDVGVKAGGEFVSLPRARDQVIHGGEWYPVQREAVDALQAWLTGVEGAQQGTGSLATLIALRTRRDMPGELVDTVNQGSAGLAAAVPVAENSISGLVADLYPYQAEGVGFLQLVAAQGIGCVLADEMGLGKTLQVVALLQHERNLGHGSSLVIAPATLLENWRRELKQFAPGLTVHIHAGIDRPGVVGRIARADVVVVSYETAIRDEPMLSAVRWNIVALDEAQNIKNPEAQRSIVVKRLPRLVSIAVTGTPLENRLSDLWSITDFVLPGLLGDINAFRREYKEAVEDASRLGQLVAPVILRRRVLDVAKDLPEKIEIPQPLLMPPSLGRAYEDLRLQTLAEFGPAGGLVATTKLRMLCAHPSLVTAWKPDPFEEMPKMVRLLEILEEVFAAGERALVFSTYQATADLLKAALFERYPGGFFRVIDGRVAVPDRQPIVDEFFSSGAFGALFLNPKAAGAGLNITAANHVIHFNPEWNPALTDQATARAYRRKQTRPVTVHYLYFLGTVEEVIVNRAAFKRELAGEAVTGHEGDIEPSAIARALQISPLGALQEAAP
jgi:SNF2 family DNA or RNA helicase